MSATDKRIQQKLLMTYVSIVAMKLSFSLANKSAKPTASSLKPPTAFASLDDDDTVGPVKTKSDNEHVAANKSLLAQTSKAAKKRIDRELKVDPTVYQYDEVWDRMQDVKQKQKQAKEVDTKLRKVSASTLPFSKTLLIDSLSSPNT